ncbi:hypothetical protein KC571_02270, partial [candidate division WWE3 bacterium]|nr:hypothetical protein [candidate division WWE3 bacterium]
MMKKQLTNSNGQVLLLTLLVAIVALTVVVAASTRTTTDVRQSESSTESERAFSAAEAGVEEKLFEISQGTSVPATCDDTDLNPGNDCNLTVGDANVDRVAVSAEQAFSVNDVEPEQVIQIRLVNDLISPGSGYNSNITFTWDRYAAMVATVVMKTGFGNYVVDRYAWKCGSVPNAQGFQTTVPSGSPSRCARTLNIGSIEGVNNALLVRLRPMYQRTYVGITPSTTLNFPVQSVEITSTGSSIDSERTVQVNRINDLLPGIFDFAMFSGSTSRSIDGDTNASSYDWIQTIGGNIHSQYSGVGNGINLTIPNPAWFCSGSAGCVASSADNGISINRVHSDSAKRWRATSEDIDVTRYTYDQLWERLKDQATDGTDFDDPAINNALSNAGTPGVIRITTGDGGAFPNRVTLNKAMWAELDNNKPVVIFIGNDSNNLDLYFHDSNRPETFTGKNVIFVVSGDVEITSNIYTVEATVVADGE